MFKKLTCLLLLAALLCAVLTGCGPSQDPEPDPTPSGNAAKAADQPIALHFRDHDLSFRFGFLSALDVDEIEMFKEQEDSTKAVFEFEGIHGGSDYLSVDLQIQMGTLGAVLDLDLPEDTDHSGYLPSLVDQMGIMGNTVIYELGNIGMSGGYSWLRCCTLDEAANPMQLEYRAVASLESTALVLDIEAVCMRDGAKAKLTDLAQTIENWITCVLVDANVAGPEKGAVPALEGKTLSGLPVDLVSADSYYYNAQFGDYHISAYEGYNSYKGDFYTVTSETAEAVRKEILDEMSDMGYELAGNAETVKGYYDWSARYFDTDPTTFLADGEGHGLLLLFKGRVSGPDVTGKPAPAWLTSIELS